jgi:hypothetical protein
MKMFFKNPRALSGPAASGYMMRRILFFSLLAFTLISLALRAETAPNPSPAPATPVAKALEQAKKQFKDQNWAEARDSFDHARDLAGDWHSPEARLAVEGAVASSMKLSLWDDALTRAQAFVDQNNGRFEEAVGRRFLGGIYLSVPHEGTKQGGVYHRGQYGQGVQVSSFKKDRKTAILCYEQARDLLAGLVGNIGATADNPDTPERRKLLNAEQIGLNFDLIAALSDRQFDDYTGWGWCGWWWGSWGEPEEDSDAVDEADYEQPRWYGRYPSEQQKPTGLPVGSDGLPQFLPTPTAYAPDLGDGPKIRFLLDEVQHLDTSDTKDDIARALFRKAMICRALYGPEISDRWNNTGTQYDRFGHPLPKPPDPGAPAKKIWDLADDEAIAIAGGHLQVVTLPADESPLALLGQVETLCPKSSLVPEAIYTRALYFQSRQQFPQAIAEYQRLRQAFPKEKRCKDAQDQIDLIRKPGVLFDSTGIHLPGDKPVLSFGYRNTGAIHFIARRFDLSGYINRNLDSLNEQNYWKINNLGNQLFEKDDWKDFTGKTAAEWTETVTLNEANRTEAGKTAAPLTEPGAYIVEAAANNVKMAPTRLLVLVTDIAILHKNIPNKGLICVADARTGQPIANHPVRIIETWNEYDQPNQQNRYHVTSTMLNTNQDGAIEYQRKQPKYGGNIDAIVTGDNNRMAFSFFQNWEENDYGPQFENGPRFYVITDRPVYRPGATVKFRVWVRNRNNGAYQNASPGEKMKIEIVDPKNSKMETLHLTTDESGSVTGEYALDETAPLGVYTLQVNDYAPQFYRYGDEPIAGGLFRVEEYKKPEFEVKVTPATTQARLGEKVSARIEARYYFGAPVALGQVSYKVYREDYHHVYWGPAEYDWLYGAGYGHDYYPYPWFPWWGRWGCFILGDLWPWPYGGPGYAGAYGSDQEQMDRRSAESGTRHALRELVAQGEGQLKPDGTYDVEFDTAPALRDLGDRDHRYTIEAEVRDASRRTITGQGDVKVTRQQFYAFAETQNGWYQPQEDAFVNVRTLTADNVPVATQGKVIVYRIRYEGPGQSVEKEEEVKSWDAATDADGRLSFKYPIPGEGQYRITYLTHDNWNQEVQANTLFWVCGPAFDGRVYRFNDLEIIADKRTYKPGDTAHLLINTAEDNDRILFSDDAVNDQLRDYRFIDLPQRSTVVDVPITDNLMPNFFVEATLIRNGQVRSESRELFVPPSKNLLNLTVETDKPSYKPGEQGNVRVKLSDADGKPVSGDVTLTAFDESITYIQDEFGPAPKIHFYGQRRNHNPLVDASIDHTCNADGSIEFPQGETYLGGLPDGWNGFWRISETGLTLSGGVTAISGQEMTEDFDGYGLRSRASKSIDDLVLPWSDDNAPGSAGAESDATTVSAAAPMGAVSGIGGVARGGGGLEGGADLSEYGGSSNLTHAWYDKGVLGSLFSSPKLVDPAIRSNFADSALWLPDLKTDANGHAETTITFPDSPSPRSATASPTRPPPTTSSCASRRPASLSSATKPSSPPTSTTTSTRAKPSPPN